MAYIYTMTLTEFKNELREASQGFGFRRGERVIVCPDALDKHKAKYPHVGGVTGTVQTKMIRGPGDVLQGVKFDDPITDDGRMFGAFDALDLIEAPAVEGRPTEIDLLGQRIRRT